MSKLLVISVFLTLNLTVESDAPDAASQQSMLEKVHESAAHYLQALPNFVCARVTEQNQAGRKPEHWKRLDTLTARLIFNQGKENVTLELVNGKPIQPGRYVDQRLDTNGEFGESLLILFDARSDAKIAWNRWEELNDRRMAVFEYSVDSQHSTLQLDEAKGVPYHGLLFVDPDTGELWRFTTEAADSANGKSVSTIDYGRVEINNKRYLLPVSADILLTEGRHSFWNKISFKDYRKFDAESKITFVSGSN